MFNNITHFKLKKFLKFVLMCVWFHMCWFKIEKDFKIDENLKLILSSFMLD